MPHRPLFCFLGCLFLTLYFPCSGEAKQKVETNSGLLPGKPPTRPVPPRPVLPLTPGGIPEQALELLRTAKQLAQSRNLPQAWEYFRQAKAYAPNLPEPLWLRQPDSVLRSPLTKTRADLLQAATGTMKPQDRQQLEALLNRNPGDSEVRRVLLRLAKEEGNAAEIQRHQSILNPTSPSSWASYIGYVFLGITGCLVIWQIFLLWKDIKDSDPNSPPEKPI